MMVQSACDSCGLGKRPWKSHSGVWRALARALGRARALAGASRVGKPYNLLQLGQGFNYGGHLFMCCLFGY